MAKCRYYDIRHDDEKGRFKLAIDDGWRSQTMTTDDWDVFLDLVAANSLTWPSPICGIYEGDEPMKEYKIDDMYAQIRETYGVGNLLVE